MENQIQVQISANSRSIEELQKTLIDPNVDIAERFRCIFTLKAIHGNEAIDALSQGIKIHGFQLIIAENKKETLCITTTTIYTHEN